MIREELNMLWTDSFNLRILNDEMIDLLREAGCFRMDVGTTCFDPYIQNLHNNVFRNEDLEKLRRISSRGIWVHGNIIANLLYHYSVERDLEILEEYVLYMDGSNVNSYRSYPYSFLEQNYERFDLTRVSVEKDSISERGEEQRLKLPFIENEFQDSLEERKRLFENNFYSFKTFLEQKNIMVNEVHLPLLAYLYQVLGFDKKEEIREIVSQVYYFNDN